MKQVSSKKEFMSKVGANLLRAFQQSKFTSQRSLATASAERGFGFSPELIAKYFNGTVEPGVFAFCGLLLAMGKSADEILFGEEPEIKGEKRKRYVAKVAEKMRKQMQESGYRSAVQVAIMSENQGYPLLAERVDKFLKGTREPGIYEFAGILTAIGGSADSILLERDAQADADSMLKGTADKLVDLLKKTGRGDSRTQELAKLFKSASPKVQDAVLELLRSAGKK